MGSLRLAKLRQQLQQALQFGFLQLPDSAREARRASAESRPGAARSRTTISSATGCSSGLSGSGSISSACTVAVRTFGGGDQLNHFFRTSKPVLDPFRVGTERLGGEGCRDPCFGKTSVFGDEPNFINPNARVIFIGEVPRQSVGKRSGIWAGFHEAFNQIDELL